MTDILDRFHRDNNGNWFYTHPGSDTRALATGVEHALLEHVRGLDHQIEQLEYKAACAASTSRLAAAIRTAGIVETERAMTERVATALEHMTCHNCDDRKCMACVLREHHTTCHIDCPTCTPDTQHPNHTTHRWIERQEALDAYTTHRNTHTGRQDEARSRQNEHGHGLNPAVFNAGIAAALAELWHTLEPAEHSQQPGVCNATADRSST